MYYNQHTGVEPRYTAYARILRATAVCPPRGRQGIPPQTGGKKDNCITEAFSNHMNTSEGDQDKDRETGGEDLALCRGKCAAQARPA